MMYLQNFTFVHRMLVSILKTVNVCVICRCIYARALLTGSSSMSMTCGTGRLFSRPRMHFDAHYRDQTAPLYLAALDPVGFRLPPCTSVYYIRLTLSADQHIQLILSCRLSFSLPHNNPSNPLKSIMEFDGVYKLRTLSDDAFTLMKTMGRGIPFCHQL